MNIVAVVNTKGGVGKTTLTSALAVRASQDGASVVIADLDPQRSAFDWWQRRGSPPNPTVMPAAGKLTQTIAGLPTSVEWVFIDSPPAFLVDIEAAIDAATFVAIPVKTSFLDLASTKDAIEMCQDAEKPYAVIINDVVHTDMKIADAVRRTLAGQKIPVCETVIGHRASHLTAATVGKTGPEVNGGKDAKAVEEIDALWTEVKAAVRKAAKASKKREAAHE